MMRMKMKSSVIFTCNSALKPEWNYLLCECTSPGKRRNFFEIWHKVIVTCELKHLQGRFLSMTHFTPPLQLHGSMGSFSFKFSFLLKAPYWSHNLVWLLWALVWQMKATNIRWIYNLCVFCTPVCAPFPVTWLGFCQTSSAKLPITPMDPVSRLAILTDDFDLSWNEDLLLLDRYACH